MSQRPLPLDRLPDLPDSPDGQAGLSTAQVTAQRALGFNDIVLSEGAGWHAVLRDSLRDPMLWFLLLTAALFAALGQQGEAFTLLIAIAPQRVLLFGESLGSAQAVMLAARQPADARPGALLLDSSFDSAEALAAGHYPFVPVRWLMRDPHRADQAAAQLKLPVLQVHCARDAVSPLAHAQKLQAAFAQRSELLVLDGDCHVPGYGLYRERVKALVAQLRGP